MPKGPWARLVEGEGNAFPSTKTLQINGLANHLSAPLYQPLVPAATIGIRPTADIHRTPLRRAGGFKRRLR